MLCNIIYKVQIGALKKELPSEFYNKYKPISTERTANGLTRYLFGAFTSYAKAEKARQEVLNSFPDAFVVAYLNAVKISTTDARKVEAGEMECNENLYPKVEFVADQPVTKFENVTTSNTASYEHYFGYNKDKFNYNDSEFRAFAERVKKLTQEGKVVKIYVTSSASRVPTSTYKNNLDLAAHRMSNGKVLLEKMLTELGVDMSKVKIIEREATVNGPTYKNDATTNSDVYRKYQFIKFDIEF